MSRAEAPGLLLDDRTGYRMNAAAEPADPRGKFPGAESSMVAAVNSPDFHKPRVDFHNDMAMALRAVPTGGQGGIVPASAALSDALMTLSLVSMGF
jgi:hypothetical protein